MLPTVVLGLTTTQSRLPRAQTKENLLLHLAPLQRVVLCLSRHCLLLCRVVHQQQLVLVLVVLLQLQHRRQHQHQHRQHRGRSLWHCLKLSLLLHCQLLHPCRCQQQQLVRAASCAVVLLIVMAAVLGPVACGGECH